MLVNDALLTSLVLLPQGSFLDWAEAPAHELTDYLLRLASRIDPKRVNTAKHKRRPRKPKEHVDADQSGLMSRLPECSSKLGKTDLEMTGPMYPLNLQEAILGTMDDQAAGRCHGDGASACGVLRADVPEALELFESAQG